MPARRFFALALAFALTISLESGQTTRAATATTVRIVSSLPMQGASAPFTRAMVNAIRLALSEIPPGAGVRIEYGPLDELDDGDANGDWQTASEAANAQKALSDRAVVAYIGPFNSGAARVSIPILCAGSLAMVSPSNTYPGLTRPGFDANEPERYYPDCRRNYARVIADDDVQGRIGAAWALSLGAHAAYVLTPDTAFARRLAVGFRSEAEKIGLREAGFEVVTFAFSQVELAARIVASGADVVYYSGFAGGPGIVLRDLRGAGSQALFIGSSAATSAIAAQAGAAGTGALATLETWNASDFQARAVAFRVRYLARYGEDPSDYAIYAYDAARAVIAAIRAAGPAASDRARVRDDLMATRHFTGALGCWSFDHNGDTNFATVSTAILVGGQWQPSGAASLRSHPQPCGTEMDESHR